jgi:hypothetical protein
MLPSMAADLPEYFPQLIFLDQEAVRISDIL